MYVIFIFTGTTWPNGSTRNHGISWTTRKYK